MVEVSHSASASSQSDNNASRPQLRQQLANQKPRERNEFVGHFVIEPDEDERTAFVHEQFSYESDLLGRRIVIPKGFRTDGASVPRLFWNIIPPWGRYGMAAVIHDYLYRWQRTSRRMADDTLLEAMWVKRCAFWQYACIWIAVRIAGSFAWKSDQAKPLSAAELAVNP